MIWIILVVIIYILGVVKCRKDMIKAMIRGDYFKKDFVDVIICLMPFFHWGFIIFLWWEDREIGENIANKFFGRK